MQTDVIEAVGIDESGSIWLKPATATFPTSIVSRWRFIGMPSVRALSVRSRSNGPTLLASGRSGMLRAAECQPEA